MYGLNVLSILSIFCLSAAKIIHNVDEYLYEPHKFDLTQNGSAITLYVRLCEWSSMNGSLTVINMTRYCYCNESKSDDPADKSCSVPGPTLVMHDYTAINVTVVSELKGSATFNSHSNNFKDMDITNIHVHGLHVDPAVDDVLINIYPYPGNPSRWLYQYKFGYHYPGTFWYHAHNHGSTTWQVNMGLHGAISMNQDNDTISDEYEENILMFEWYGVVPKQICNPCPVIINGSINNSRFADSNGVNYDMCDVYCSFPEKERNASGYVYDVTTQLPINSKINFTDCNDDQLLFYFVNGQLSPKIKMKTGVLRRLRMINSLSNWYLQFQFPSECDWYLIATDGVYIGGEYQNYPLASSSHNNQYIMAPGGRADFMVNCTAGTHEIITTRNNSQDEVMLSRMNSERACPNKVLFKLEVNDSNSNGPRGLPSNKSVPMKKSGTYIQDLTQLNKNEYETTCDCNYNDSVHNACNISFMFVKVNGSTFGAVNGKPFGVNMSQNYPYTADSLFIIEEGKAYEFIINNDGNNFAVAHVYHQHINPFQVQTHVGNNGFIALNTTWWDTIGNSPNKPDELIRMRFWAKDYYGLIITHCHLLQHEDNGMMGFYEIMNSSEFNKTVSSCPNQQIKSKIIH